MKFRRYFYLTAICFLMGILFISFQKQWIILTFPAIDKNTTNSYHKVACHKKKIILFCWKNDKWFSEQTEILWSDNIAENITNLTQNWLILLDDEKITSNKITLQSVLLTTNQQTAYLSFDQVLFSKDSNTYQKLMLIESLLKTFRSNQISTPHIQFLVQHQLIKDSHLDFSNSWPINGFLTN